MASNAKEARAPARAGAPRLAAAVLSACFVWAAPAAAQTLRVCVDPTYPPFSSLGEKGELVGFDIDIARALCERIGAECDLVSTAWDAIIPSLEEGKCDAIVASMAITEERRARVDFTEKYQQTPIRFVAPEEADWEDTPEGMAGRRICVQRGTIHQDYLEGVFPDAELALYPTQQEAFLDLSVGRCDAAMADQLAAEAFLATPEGEELALRGRNHLDPRWHGEGAGIAVRKADDALRERLNEGIRALRESGEYRRINDRYFDFDIYGS